MSRSTETGSGGAAGSAPAARMELEVRGRGGDPSGPVAMQGDRLLIGREEGDIRIDNLLVSRQHAEIEPDGEGGFRLTDLSSTNGTFLNGRLLVAPARLADGDDVRIGPAHLLVRIQRD